MSGHQEGGRRSEVVVVLGGGRAGGVDGATCAHNPRNPKNTQNTMTDPPLLCYHTIPIITLLFQSSHTLYSKVSLQGRRIVVF